MKRGKIRNAKKSLCITSKKKKRKKTFKEKNFADDKNFRNRKVNASKKKKKFSVATKNLVQNHKFFVNGSETTKTLNVS